MNLSATEYPWRSPYLWRCCPAIARYDKDNHQSDNWRIFGVVECVVDLSAIAGRNAAPAHGDTRCLCLCLCLCVRVCLCLCLCVRAYVCVVGHIDVSTRFHASWSSYYREDRTLDVTLPLMLTRTQACGEPSNRRRAHGVLHEMCVGRAHIDAVRPFFTGTILCFYRSEDHCPSRGIFLPWIDFSAPIPLGNASWLAVRKPDQVSNYLDVDLFCHLFPQIETPPNICA